MTQRGNFPENDREAIQNLYQAQAIVMLFLDELIKLGNEDNQEALALWEAAKALNESAGVYSS